jgi:tRNA(Ile)-lysidine synthetase-like protein
MFLLNILGSFSNIDFSKFENILEYIPCNNNKISNQAFEDDEMLICFKKYVKLYDKKKYVVSLSGGVDSMIVATILCYLGYEVIGIHINYNNREETKDEEKFMEDWCKYNGIKLYVKSIEDVTRGSIKRSDYESYTRNIRFDLYKEVLAAESCDEILLGHHKDDIVENIVANVCRGRNVLDLAVIKETSVVNGVKMVRPMINFYKESVYKFAHNNNVPYFKDTTPDWSVRGKYRNKVHSNLEDTFGENVKENLIGLARQSDEWNMLIMKQLIDPFLESVKHNYDGHSDNVYFNVENYLKHPLCFWNLVFAKLFYRYGKNSPSKKGIQTFMNSIPGNGKVSISNSCICKVTNNNVLIIIKT